MTDTSPPTATAQSLDGVDGVVVEPLPVYSGVGGYSVRGVLTTLGLFVIAAGGALTSSIFSGRPAPRWILAVGAVIGFAILLTVVVAKRVRARRAAHAAVRDPLPPWATLISECNRSGHLLSKRSEIERIWQRLADRPDRPRVVVDAALAPALALVPCPDHLLEPEAINQSQRGAIFLAAMFTWLGISALLQRRGGDWWNAAVFFGVAVVFLLRVARVRDAIPMLRDTGSDLVAGPGWLRQRDGRRWTVADSLAILQRSERGKKAPGVWVRFIGPPGVRDVQFDAATNPDLALLWERWMHPKPRLELEV